MYVNAMKQVVLALVVVLLIPQFTLAGDSTAVTGMDGQTALKAYQNYINYFGKPASQRGSSSAASSRASSQQNALLPHGAPGLPSGPGNVPSVPGVPGGVINPATGDYYPGTGAGGAINPATGQHYPGDGAGGAINPATGQHYPGTGS